MEINKENIYHFVVCMNTLFELILKLKREKKKKNENRIVIAVGDNNKYNFKEWLCYHFNVHVL
jgi:hypothetical protein